jgi:hypothetical protein
MSDLAFYSLWVTHRWRVVGPKRSNACKKRAALARIVAMVRSLRGRGQARAVQHGTACWDVSGRRTRVEHQQTPPTCRIPGACRVIGVGSICVMELWGAGLYGQPCRGCGFDWDVTPTDALATGARIPAQFAERLVGATGRERHPELLWTPSMYVSHVADNLRIWAERLTGARVAGAAEVVGYDQDLLARVRRYDEIALPAALWSLDWASRAWVEVVEDAVASDVVLWHETRGEQRGSDVARNNAHDAYHHLLDVSRILGLVRSS